MGLLIFHDNRDNHLTDMLFHAINRHKAKFYLEPKIIYIYLHDAPDPTQIYLFSRIPVYPVLWMSPNHTLSMEEIVDDPETYRGHIFEIAQKNSRSTVANVSSRRANESQDHQQYSFDGLSDDFKVS